jgi:hypothetical protein
MSEAYFPQQQPTLIWNPVRGVWEKLGMVNLLCEHSELFSETWPTSGMTQNGQVFELPMQVLRTTDSEFSLSPIPDSSLLRTVVAGEVEGGAVAPAVAKAKGQTLRLSGQMIDMVAPNQLPKLMPTPNTMDHLPARTPEQKAANKGKGGYSNVRETVINDLFPTPAASEGTKAPAQQDAEIKGKNGQFWLSNVAKGISNENEILLMGTPRANAAESSSVQVEAGAPKGRIEDQVKLTEWGKFEPAIRRWEEVLGRPAPAPTKPDGKDGAHRLSSAFTEWMMGLPEGWITDCGLTRNEELKACGNGVVPQQAELALRVLLEGVPLPVGGGQVNLPTPTVSDTYTDNLASSQQKPGSMHSVTLPQAVKWVTGE